MIIISVIIPVHNAQEFLERCLNSVLSQTINCIEVICIDDCSTDHSFEILNQFAQKDIRLKCFRNELNIGQGLTRNKGLDVAKGEYVSFIDCDDWIEPNMFDVLYSKNRLKKYDIIFCNFFCDLSKNKTIIPDFSKVENVSLDFLLKESISPTIKNYSPNSPWGKLYRNEYLIENNIRFESERVLMYEDKFFNLTLFVLNPCIYFEKKAYYHYVTRPGSTMISYQKNFVDRYFILDEKIKNIFIKHNIMSDELSNRFRTNLFELTFSFCLNALVYNKSFKGKFFEFCCLLNNKKIVSNVKYFELKDIPSSSSKLNGVVKSCFFLILKYLK
jgi:glycosyltransferase involved in cell wall biosynthesis